MDSRAGGGWLPTDLDQETLGQGQDRDWDQDRDRDLDSGPDPDKPDPDPETNQTLLPDGQTAGRASEHKKGDRDVGDSSGPFSASRGVSGGARQDNCMSSGRRTVLVAWYGVSYSVCVDAAPQPPDCVKWVGCTRVASAPDGASYVAGQSLPVSVPSCELPPVRSSSTRQGPSWGRSSYGYDCVCRCRNAARRGTRSQVDGDWLGASRALCRRSNGGLLLGGRMKAPAGRPSRLGRAVRLFTGGRPNGRRWQDA